MPPFTRQNAREMQLKGVKAKREKLWRLMHPEPAPVATPNPASKRLERTRQQLDRLRDHLDRLIKRRSPDARQLKALTDSIATLEDVERELDGRPRAGIAKHTQSRANPQLVALAAWTPEPSPATSGSVTIEPQLTPSPETSISPTPETLANIDQSRIKDAQ